MGYAIFAEIESQQGSVHTYPWRVEWREGVRQQSRLRFECQLSAKLRLLCDGNNLSKHGIFSATNCDHPTGLPQYPCGVDTRPTLVMAPYEVAVSGTGSFLRLDIDKGTTIPIPANRTVKTAGAARREGSSKTASSGSMCLKHLEPVTDRFWPTIWILGNLRYELVLVEGFPVGKSPKSRSYLPNRGEPQCPSPGNRS